MSSNRAAQAAEICERAATRLEQGWCQGVAVTNGDGIAVGPDDADACRFCTVGAVWAANHDFSDEAVDLRLLIFQAIAKITRSVNIAQWNDTPGRTQAEAVGAMRRTAQYLREEAQRKEGADAGTTD